MRIIEITQDQAVGRLRRIALASQGLLQAQPFGSGLAGARAAIKHLGYVQIDTISVVERAHHHVLHTRVPKFIPSMTNKLLLDGDVFEYWAHAAAFIPISDFRFSLPYKHAIKSGQRHWYKNTDKQLMKELLDRVRIDGPLRSRDLESTPNKSLGWWDWKPAKKALEQLYMEGELMVCDRAGFQKTYDLTERVLPEQVNTSLPTIEEFAAHLVEQQLRCHGLITIKGVTYLRKNPALRLAVKAFVNERLAQGEFEQVRLSGGEIFIIEAGAMERRIPRAGNRLSILSPFDNSVIQRERIKTLFGYEYQIECYVPEAKRRYGYFCLPLLFRDKLVGRMDCKAHRKDKHLEIKSLYFEQHGYDQAVVNEAFVESVLRFCQFQQCDTVSLLKVIPNKLSKNLRALIKTRLGA